MVVQTDVYELDVDFTALALQSPDFAKRLKSNGQLDFSDPESVRQLTKALLRRDFDLTIDLPEDRLCPPVPNRFNYINFVQKLVDSTRPDFNEQSETPDKVLALDIGTGASAIYPLLACRQRPTWYFLATEIDPKSRSYAQQNINTNNLHSNIRIVSTDQSGKTILPSSEFEHLDDLTIKVMLTNPPFYSSTTELLQSASQKSRPPNSACTGSPIEMITKGGEIQFVSQIIQESSLPANRHKIQWFSSMLGKFSSLSVIISRLKESNCTNYVVTDFIQGQKTRRWCVAWSWVGFRPPTSIARGSSSLEKNLLPFPSEFDLELKTGSNIEDVIRRLTDDISGIDPTYTFSKSTMSGIASFPTGDIWSRKARKKKLRQQQQQQQHVPDDDETTTDLDVSEPLLIVRTSLHIKSPDRNQNLGLTIRWLQGHDSVQFESFCGWLKRKLD